MNYKRSQFTVTSDIMNNLWPVSMNYELQKITNKELWTTKGHNDIMNNILNDKKGHKSQTAYL